MGNNLELKEITIAHRGIHNNKNIPENSMKAFEEAIKQNMPIELDVHITKDNKIVVFHDDNLKRMTGLNKKIRNLTYLELQDLNLLNTNEKIPLFQDVLHLINGKVLLDIEIKSDRRIKDMNTLLSNMLDNYQGKFLVKSFSPRYIRWFKVHRPNYIRGLLVVKKKTNYHIFITSKLFLNYIKPHFLAVDQYLANTKRMQKLRKQGILIFIWGIKGNDEIEIMSYADSYII